MHKLGSSFIEKILDQSDKIFYLKIIEKIFIKGIPFNIPHKIKFIKMTDDVVILKLPYIKSNKNHLSGIHACASATVGEFSAGLSLVKHFGSSKYRIIMTELNVCYHKQAKEELFGITNKNIKEFKNLENQLQSIGVAQIEINTEIQNKEQEKIASVTTKWQLKTWSTVS
jgi:acyl-coenzyme A thioesterase PaaI-like protein